MSDNRSPQPEIVRVPFHGEEVLTVDVDGTPHLLFKPAVEAIGVDYWTQVEKLRKRSWACTSQRLVQVPGDTQRREMLTVDVRTFLMLLATIDERRVPADVRPKLIAYQAEVAQVVEQYWTQGGAINPRASHDQLERIASLTERRIAMLRLADGLVDRAWLEAKTRHEIARGLGEEPEVDADTRPLTVGEYLEERGVTGNARRSLSTRFGKQLKALYVAEYGQQPGMTERFIDGALRQVAGYTEQHRPIFDRVYRDLLGDDEPNGLRSIPDQRGDAS